MKVSLILPSYRRPELLDLGLLSIASQRSIHDLEVIVVNDGIRDNTSNIAKQYLPNLNIRYIFSGYRNLGKEPKFRSPSVAMNIGIKKARGDIVIFSCPEMFHLNNVIDLLVTPLIEDKNYLASPKHIYFDNNDDVRKYISEARTLKWGDSVLKTLESGTKRTEYASRLPFCMAMWKSKIVEIGGYDEEFSGWACDDDDIVERLILNGMKYKYTEGKIIHLYHKKQYNRKTKNQDKDYLYNLKLFKERKGIIVRNKNKEWGVL